MADTKFEKLAIIGIGLLGSSIAHAVRTYGGAAKVALWDGDADVRALAKRVLGADVPDTAAAAVKDANCVILCTPVGVLGAVTELIAGALQPGAILTDVGSVKATPAAEMAAHCPDGVHLVPGHPIAGTEKSGPESGFASLFQDAWHILTPLKAAEGAYGVAVERLTQFWRGLGARVPKPHDKDHKRGDLLRRKSLTIWRDYEDPTVVEQSDLIQLCAAQFATYDSVRDWLNTHIPTAAQRR